MATARRSERITRHVAKLIRAERERSQTTDRAEETTRRLRKAVGTLKPSRHAHQ